MGKILGFRWVILTLSATMLLVLAAACTSTETVEVPGETVIVEKEVVKEVQVPGETVIVEKEVVKVVSGKSYVTDPANGKTVTAPQYGGTLTYPRTSDWPHADTHFHHHPGTLVSNVIERLGLANWATPTSEHDFVAAKNLPERILIGHLAESWEQTDTTTYVFHMRDDVKWEDKAPTNGRLLTAQDIEYNFNRYFALGKWSGGDKASLLTQYKVASVEATDDHTVVVKMEAQDLAALKALLQSPNPFIYAPEVIEEHGDAKDWRNLVGTGPYRLDDWTEGTSATFSRKVDYWNYDEKYPENRLPYIDETRVMIIPEPATQLAGLRSGKLDAVGMTFGSSMLKKPDQVASLSETNPELNIYPFGHRSETSLAFNSQKAPWSDIRVRRAMQMSLDLETINSSYWKGWGDVAPQSYFRRGMPWTTPYEEWSSELLGYYTYNKEGAEALLDEAGYPRDSDGIRFKATMHFSNKWDNTVYELLAEYMGKVGVEVEAIAADSASRKVLRQAGEHDLMSQGAAVDRWVNLFACFLPGLPNNVGNVDDPALIEIINNLSAASSVEEQHALITEASDHITEQHYTLFGGRVPRFHVTWPWVVGFNGEQQLGEMDRNQIWARLWIDQDLKNAMGY